jgi:hypothetical protein
LKDRSGIEPKIDIERLKASNSAEGFQEMKAGGRQWETTDFGERVMARSLEGHHRRLQRGTDDLKSSDGLEKLEVLRQTTNRAVEICEEKIGNVRWPWQYEAQRSSVLLEWLFIEWLVIECLLSGYFVLIECLLSVY